MSQLFTITKAWTSSLIPGVTRLVISGVFVLLLSSPVSSTPDHEPMVPMNDNVALKTFVYLPADSGQHPAVLIRSPYSGSWLESVGSRFAESGYATVIQYVRGMSGSEGQFIPFVNEHTDGTATLKWITKQSWSDGRVGIWGVSYLSFCGFEVARAQDPAIKGMVNISGWANLNTFLTEGGAMRLLDHLPWLISYAGGQTQIPDQAWEGIFLTTPLSQFFGDVEEVGSAMAAAYDYSKITVPVLHVTGWNDYICSSTLEVYHQSKAFAGESKLLVGPWTHNQAFDRDSTKYGDADFGDSSRLGLDSLLTLSVAWFDAHVKGSSTGIEAIPPVQYFMQGANRWSQCENWPPSTSVKETWYLRSAESEALLLKEPQSRESWLEFVYDPNNPVPTIGGAVSFRRPFNVGVKDQSSLKGRADILFFESSPLEEPLDIAGPATVVFYATTDSTDTDFTAKFVEVTGDGYARMIEDGIIRARYGDNPDSAILISPNTVRRYEIKLGETAYRVSAGSKLRLEISSGNFPKYDRNPNDGTEPFEATSFRKAHQRVFMSKEYPSSLTLTVMRN